MMSYKNWRLSSIHHSIFGIISLGLTMSMVIGGFFGWLRRSMNRPWQTASMLKIKKVHMYFAYFVFFFVQLAVCSGILARVRDLNQSVGA